MGVCLSCLGLTRRQSTEPDEHTRLLPDGTQNPQYHDQSHDLGGGSDFRARLFPQPSPEQLRRETDVLERACTTTSDKLIDVSPNSTVHAQQRSTSNLDGSQSEDAGAATAPAAASGENGEDEQTWLRKVLERDPLHKRWDPNLLPSLTGRAVVNFEDMLASDERPMSAKQALKDAIA